MNCIPTTSSEDCPNAIEGAIARNLFRTDDDSSEDEDGECGDDATTPQSLNASQESADHERIHTFVQYPIMDIVLEEQTIGGSIAQRLWPAAAYLANFIMTQHASSSQASDESHTTRSTISVPTTIIELGAGVGLTGLQLATFFHCRVLLTDLPDAMPLLLRNIELNRKRFLGGEAAVQAQVLTWGNQDDAESALLWAGHTRQPVLIIASDCVYFPKLHTPLEQTLCHLLKGDRTGIKCLIAGMRRWKSDNAFFKNIGTKTKTTTHQLICECLQETVTRTEQNQREIIRVFSIEWNERQKKKPLPRI